jgi:carbonic anhydrase
MCELDHARPCPRRAFIRDAAAAAVVATTFGLGLPRTARAQTTLSPDAALQLLREGNRRYVEQRLESFEKDLVILRQDTEEKQEPFAAVLSCADSRVPPEIIFDLTIGQLFVTRVAGNIATTEIIASLEYGAAVLGTVVIAVLGHGSCGAVKAAIAANEVPGQISALYAPLRAAVDRAGPDSEAAIKANAQIQARLLSEASPVLAGLISAGRLKIAAAYYDLQQGQVEFL